MTVHTAFTGFDTLAPGAMIFLEGDAPIAAGDVVDVTLAETGQTRLTIKETRPGSILATEEGRADPWALDLTEHGLSDFPVLIVPLGQSLTGEATPNAAT